MAATRAIAGRYVVTADSGAGLLRVVDMGAGPDARPGPTAIPISLVEKVGLRVGAAARSIHVFSWLPAQCRWTLEITATY
jgi:hypothetical protein